MTNPEDTTPANPAQVTDAMVEAACRAWIKADSPLESAMRAALTAAIGAAPEEDTQSQWRDLALQFDGHRIQAMCLLRAIAADKAGKTEIEAFLSAPPLSGEQVLADRLAAIGAGGQAVIEEDGTDSIAVEICDVVMDWMVRRGLIDADQEYHPSEIVEALEGMFTDPTAPSHPPHPADERVVEAMPHPLEAYADSYAQMARMGDGRVDCRSVEVDIRRNMIPVTAALAAGKE